MNDTVEMNKGVVLRPSINVPKLLLDKPTEAVRENSVSPAKRPEAPVSACKKPSSRNTADKPPPRSSEPRRPK